jgi:small multidrug resistance pump
MYYSDSSNKQKQARIHCINDKARKETNERDCPTCHFSSRTAEEQAEGRQLTKNHLSRTMSDTMHWAYLILAIIAEVAGTTLMKICNGFSKPGYVVLMVGCYATWFVLLTLALKKIDISVAYGIWSGLGTALVAMVGLFYFREHFSVMKAAGLVAIITGVVLLKVSSH